MIFYLNVCSVLHFCVKLSKKIEDHDLKMRENVFLKWFGGVGGEFIENRLAKFDEKTVAPTNQYAENGIFKKKTYVHFAQKSWVYVPSVHFMQIFYKQR